MIRESLSDEEDDHLFEDTKTFEFNELVLLSIATSIDAFAIGISYAMLNESIMIPSMVIGIIVFIFTILGIFLGKKVGDYLGDKFEIMGGVVLILIAFKILLDGLGFL